LSELAVSKTLVSKGIIIYY